MNKRSSVELLVPVALIFTVLLLLTGCRIYNAWKETKNIKIKKTKPVTIIDIVKYIEQEKDKYEKEGGAEISFNGPHGTSVGSKGEVNTIVFDTNCGNTLSILDALKDIMKNLYNNPDFRYIKEYLIKGYFRNKKEDNKCVTLYSRELEIFLSFDPLNEADIKMYPTKTLNIDKEIELSIAERAFNDFGRKGKR